MGLLAIALRLPAKIVLKLVAPSKFTGEGRLAPEPEPVRAGRPLWSVISWPSVASPLPALHDSTSHDTVTALARRCPIPSLPATASRRSDRPVDTCRAWARTCWRERTQPRASHCYPADPTAWPHLAESAARGSSSPSLQSRAGEFDRNRGSAPGPSPLDQPGQRRLDRRPLLWGRPSATCPQRPLRVYPSGSPWGSRPGAPHQPPRQLQLQPQRQRQPRRQPQPQPQPQPQRPPRSDPGRTPSDFSPSPQPSAPASAPASTTL